MSLVMVASRAENASAATESDVGDNVVVMSSGVASLVAVVVFVCDGDLDILSLLSVVVVVVDVVSESAVVVVDVVSESSSLFSVEVLFVSSWSSDEDDDEDALSDEDVEVPCPESVS